jgi:hypothetical protein
METWFGSWGQEKQTIARRKKHPGSGQGFKGLI